MSLAIAILHVMWVELCRCQPNIVAREMGSKNCLGSFQFSDYFATKQVSGCGPL